MRVSDKDLQAITELVDRALGEAKGVVSSDLRTAVLHVRWLSTLESDRSVTWHKFYTRAFKKIGVSFPALGKDFRSVVAPSYAKKAASSPNVGRPSGRPSYCTHLRCMSCKKCPARLGRWWDCHGNPVSRTWGVEVKDTHTGTCVQVAKPSDGSMVKGNYFGGGWLWDGRVCVKVPRGTSVKTVMQELEG